MAAHIEGDNFSDDALDELPLAALDELENHAIRLTQATQARTQGRREAPPSSDYGDDFDDEDLDDAVVIDEARSAPAIVPALHRASLSQTSQREHKFLRPQFGGTAKADGPRQNAHLQPPNRDHLPSPAGLALNQPAPTSQGSQAQAQRMGEAALLRKQLEEVRRELAAVKQDNYVRTGEIATVRSQLERQARERERERTALQKSGEEKLAKQRKELEAAQIAAKAAVTERDFIKQDLLEVQRAQNFNKAAEKKDATITTPKKKKSLPHRDGFDDDEVDVMSPSKLSPSKFQKRIGTPSKGGKRKRKALDSPIAPLEVIQTEDLPPKPEQKRSVAAEISVAAQHILDDRFDFLGVMLDHRPYRDHGRTIEELGKHALPATPEESFESIILGQIPVMGRGRPTSDLPIEFCELLISLWKRCFEAKYYSPIYLLIDMLTLALEFKTLAIAPHVIDTLVPIAQLTADLVAIPRFSTGPTAPYDKDIDPSSCLELLHLAALGCVPEISHMRRFWRLMRWDFVLLILSTNQPTSDFELMLKLLSTSIFRDAFGMIAPDSNTQQEYARYIIDRLTYPLFEIPYMPTGTDRIPASMLLHLRIEILSLLMSMTRSSYASSALANHPNAVGRLVSLMSEELDVLYDYRAGHESSSLILTLSTRLLYYLVTTYELDMQTKLAPIHGGSQKYLLVLSRLNFADDDLLLESGIEMDVQGLALEMLNLKVTPEEVDEVNGAFAGCLPALLLRVSDDMKLKNTIQSLKGLSIAKEE